MKNSFSFGLHSPHHQSIQASSKGQVIRAKILKFLETWLLLRFGPLRIVGKKNILRQIFGRAIRDRATRAVFELAYIWKLRRKACSVFMLFSMVVLVLHFLAKNEHICIVLPKMFSKNLHFDRFSWIFLATRFFPENPALSVYAHYGPVTSCQISVRSYDQFSRKAPDRRTDMGQVS